MTIAVLALQGAFAEHENDSLSRRRLHRTASGGGFKKHYDGLILPGGESTVQGKLLRELGMFDIIKSRSRTVFQSLRPAQE